RVAERIRERGIPIERIERGDALVAADGSGLRIEILAPDPHAARLSPLSPNETSIALRILPRGCPGGGFWILGDVEGRGMARLLSGGDDLTADALVLPHHGHRQPLLGKLIERSRPAACIASGGGETGAREVAVELEASGRDVLATWRGGSVLSRWVDGRWQTDYWSRR
ncbi:MAG: hypothetical protein JXA90_12870, partial [Planctomycetes bacterium]|nr:hypothetical protein [Planctomycetota bacterium]